MKIFDVYWKSNSAGPSPYDNIRTEIFLLGCNRARLGNECQGCFNVDIWNNKTKKDHDVDKVVDNIKKFSFKKYVTFVGGDPLDQIEDLIKVTKKLKDNEYHIIVFSWRKLLDIIKGDYENSKYGKITKADIKSLLKNIDIFIDGEFQKDKVIFDPKARNGFNNVIGSSNQIVWDINKGFGIESKNIKELKLDKENNLDIVLNNSKVKKILL